MKYIQDRPRQRNTALFPNVRISNMIGYAPTNTLRGVYIIVIIIIIIVCSKSRTLYTVRSIFFICFLP